MNSFVANLNEYLSSSSLLAYPAAYVGGLLVSFTPCVYPIIPIQLGMIGGQAAAGATTERRRGFAMAGFLRSTLFVIGMSFIYSGLGAFASLSGTLFGQWAGSPWTYVAVGNVILLMALSMLEVFTFRMPQFLSRWNPQSKRQGYLSALLVGASSGLIVGPCTAPALGATLAFVSSRASVLFGISILFVFALGMGTLMIVLGSFSGFMSWLPNSGVWMNRVKIVFGALMLVASQYYFIEAGLRFV
jgi:thiol:disulfide interchange protein DsbD